MGVFQFAVGRLAFAQHFKAVFRIEECSFIGFGNHRLIADGPFHIQAENAGKDFLPAVQWGNIDDAQVLHDFGQLFAAACFESRRRQHIQQEFFGFILFHQEIGGLAGQFGRGAHDPAERRLFIGGKRDFQGFQLVGARRVNGRIGVFIDYYGFGAFVLQESHGFAHFGRHREAVQVDVVGKTHAAPFDDFGVGVARFADVAGLVGIIAAAHRVQDIFHFFFRAVIISKNDFHFFGRGHV